MPIAPDGTPLPYDGEESLPDPQELIRTALAALQAALVSEPDDADSQKLAQIVRGLYEIVASRQKEQEQLMGGGNMRALQRVYGQQSPV